MYTYKRNNLPKQTLEFTVTLPWADIEKEYDSSFEALRKDLEVQGFRKGKAPVAIAKKTLQKEAVYDHLIRTLVPTIYTEIVKKEDVNPVISPRLELQSAKENEEWRFALKTAESPKVTLSDKYVDKLKAAKAEVKKGDIWVPGKDKEPTPEDREKQKQAEFQAALNVVLTETQIEISDLIIEEDINRRLAKLVDDIQKVGLTMDGYLKSKNTTREAIQEGLKREIEETYKLEFALQEIADREKITVDQKDLEMLFGTIKDEKQLAQAKQSTYYYTALLRKQKTLDYINSL